MTADFSGFLSFRNTLEKLSVDKITGESLVHSQIRAVDFDAVKDSFAAATGVSPQNIDGTGNKQYPSSVDAVLDWHENTYYIEFKSGAIDNKNIRNKAEDSLLIFRRLQKDSKDAEHSIFILVYDEGRHGSPAKHDRKRAVQTSPARNVIFSAAYRWGGKEYIRFGLEYLKLYYGEVHTYTVEEFDRFLAKANGN